MAADECGVCYEYIVIEKDIVQCSSCDFITCRECCQKFLTGTSQLPHCMECKTRWNRAFLIQKFTSSWVDGNKKGNYRYHRKKMIVELAKAYTPEILADIQREKDELRETEKELHALYENLASIQQEIVEIRQDITDATSLLCGKKIFTWKEKKKEWAELNKLILKNKDFNRQEEYKLRRIADKLRHGIEKTEKPNKNYHFVCPCPRSDCKGLIEKESFRCAVCEKKICRMCREPKRSKDKTPKHICNPDTIENLKLIRLDTKPCPECAVPISKIDGCFSPDTPIILYSGNVVQAKNVTIGMELIGDDGNVRVVETLKHGFDKMYQIIQGKADSYTVNQFHSLVLKYSGDRTAKYHKSINVWKVRWFDYDKLRARTANFDIEEKANAHLETLDPIRPIEITVVDYLKLPSSTKKILSGYRSNGYTGHDNKCLTSIKIIEIGQGEYYGWSISGINRLFVLPDFTVVRNCSQMWCSQCRFVYNWDTGKRETGNVHNPHAIRWEREHGKLERNVNDIPCGGLVELYNVPTWPLGDICRTQIENIYRRTSEIYTGCLVAKDSKDICRSYLVNDIDESKWEHLLFIRDRINERNQIKLDILTTLRTLMIERFRDLSMYQNFVPPIYANSDSIEQKKILLKKFDEFMIEAEEIRIFTNEALMELCDVGTKNPPQITKEWNWNPSI